jgi:alanine dehydrogenase
VSRPTEHEIEWIQDHAILLGFLHLAVTQHERIRRLLEKKVTAVAYELVQEEDGSLPIQVPLSVAAGRMTPQIAATLLKNNFGGNGILLSGVPGVPPAEVVIIGAGTFGTAAAEAFLRIGASVYVLDKDLTRLQALDERIGSTGRLVTMVSHPFNVHKVAKFADVLVGAVLVPGDRAPVVVTREMVQRMRPRSVIIDASIDQGGCVETSRPTTHRDPTFIEENIIHYAVPNMTSVVARTATHAFNNAAWPFMQEIAAHGLLGAVHASPALLHGVCTHDGGIVNPMLARHMGMKEVTL